MDNDQQNLEELYESVLLMEMPHVEFTLEIPGKGQKTFYYDMRLELYNPKTPKEKEKSYQQLVKNTLQYISQFGSIRQFEARKQLLDALGGYMNIDLFFQKKFGKTFWNDFYNDIKHQNFSS